MSQTAELFVVDQFFDRRLIAAHRAVGIAPQPQRIDLHRQSIEGQQPTDQAVAFVENELDRFQRFDDTDQSR